MSPEEFDNLVQMTFRRCTDMLGTKAMEYAPGEDRLHNFKVAAQLQGVSPKQALAGMMAKHTISIYDMCMDDFPFTQSIWEEKIGDHINYLVLLSALVSEKQKNPVHVVRQSGQTNIDKFLDSIE